MSFSDALLEARGETEDDSAPKSAVEKPPSTLEMSAHEAKEMTDAMLRNSSLPDAGRGNEKLPKGGGSDKLPEEGDDEKHPEEEGSEKQPEETPTGKLIMPCTEKVLFFGLSLVK